MITYLLMEKNLSLIDIYPITTAANTLQEKPTFKMSKNVVCIVFTYAEEKKIGNSQ